MTLVTLNDASWLRAGRVARLATVSSRARPALTPLYFVATNEEILLGTPTWTLAARNVRATGRATVLIEATVHGETRCYRVSGPADVHIDPTSLRHYNVAVARKYVVHVGQWLNTLRHAKLIGVRRAYHRDSSARGPAAVIVVRVEDVERLSDAR
jgi:hypothetical protein